MKIKLLIISLFVLISFDFSASETTLKDKLWYQYTLEYIKLHEIMVQHATENKPSFLEDYDQVYKAELKILNSPPPSISEVMELLSSENNLNKKAALIVIRVKQIFSEDLFNTILDIYNQDDDFFTKYYAFQCFNFIDKEKIKLLEDKLVYVISKETYGNIIITAMPTLIRISPPKVIPLFIRYFKSDDTGLKTSSYVYLKKMGEEYLQEVKKQLEKENAVEALKFIKKAESGEKP